MESFVTPFTPLKKRAATPGVFHSGNSMELTLRSPPQGASTPDPFKKIATFVQPATSPKKGTFALTPLPAKRPLSRNRDLSVSEECVHWPNVRRTNTVLSQCRARVHIANTTRCATPIGSSINPFTLPRGVGISQDSFEFEDSISSPPSHRSPSRQHSAVALVRAPSSKALVRAPSSRSPLYSRQSSRGGSALKLGVGRTSSRSVMIREDDDDEDEPQMVDDVNASYEEGSYPATDFVTDLKTNLIKFEEETTRQRALDRSMRRQNAPDLFKSISFAIGPAQGAIMLRKRLVKHQKKSVWGIDRTVAATAAAIEAESRRLHDAYIRHRLVMLKWQRAVGKVIIQGRKHAASLASAAADIMAKLRKEKKDRDRAAEMKLMAEKRAHEVIAFFDGFTKKGKRELCVDGLTEKLYGSMYNRFKDLDVGKLGRVHLADVVRIVAEGGLEFQEPSFHRVDKDYMGSFAFQDIMRVLFPDCTVRQLRTLQQMFDREARREVPPPKSHHAMDVLSPEHIADIIEIFKRCDKKGKGIVYREDVERSFQDPMYIGQVGLDVVFPKKHSTLTLRDFAEVMKWSYPPFSSQLMFFF